MTGFLSRWGLAQDPFAPQEGYAPARRMPIPSPSYAEVPDFRPPPRSQEIETQEQPSLADIIRLGGRIFGEEDDVRWQMPKTLEEAIRAIPGLPAPPVRDDYQASYVPPRRARTPLEGPDTGEENPNAGGAVPAGYFARLQGPESGGDASIRNPVTGAGGLYQFLPSTWRQIMREAPQLGLTEAGFYDPSPAGRAQQDRAIRHYTDQSLRILEPMLGRQPTMGELYALHFLGPSGGPQLLRALDKPVGETVSAAAIKANPWLKDFVDKPGRALLRRFEKMMG